MQAQLNKILEEAKEQLQQAASVSDVDEIRVKLLGKKGKLTEILRGMGKLSPEEWEPMMDEFSGKLEGKLDEMRIRSVSLDLRKEFALERSENLGIASKWSHRHTAYTAGLGTFGLNDGFISERGIAIRISSIIVEADMDVTPRGDRGPYDWCLYFQNGRCGACIKRCPVDAISKDGHDKQRCLDYEDESVAKYWPSHIDKKNYIFGCGICQSKVPCRDRRP